MAIQATSDINFIKKQAILFALILLASIVSACGAAPTEVGAAETPVSGTPEGSSDSTSPTGEATQGADNLREAVASRTPLPTSTPSHLDERIGNFASEMGLSGKSFLGLAVEDWINLGISILIVILGYFLGNKLVIAFLNWVIGRISADPDDTILLKIRVELKWLVIIFVTRFAIQRLTFLSDPLRLAADDILFILQLTIFSIMGMRLVDFALENYQESLATKSDLARVKPIISTVNRLSRGLIIVLAFSVGLSHFGISVNALSAMIIVLGAIIALGAQDIISDVISGFIILTDQPYRVADRIYVKEIDTWGEVLEIGTRTTRLRTGDNRELIIPNSELANSQVINYTVLDPGYRQETRLGVAYGSDFKKVQKVIEDTVSGVDGVMKEKPVDVFFKEFGDTTRTMRVRWWIDHFKNKNPMLDRVNAALELALDKENIVMSFNINDEYDLNVNMKGDHPNSSASAVQTEE
jgi:small-conductance mechanosensitive channel